MRSKVSAGNDVLKNHESYSPEEIFAAGGTTAFGLKTAKKRAAAQKAIENAPPIEPFTDEEWADLMAQLERDK